MALVFRGAVFQNIEGIEAIIDTRYIFLVIGPKIHRSRPRHLKIDVATAAERPLTWSLDADNGNPPGECCGVHVGVMCRRVDEKTP